MASCVCRPNQDPPSRMELARIQDRPLATLTWHHRNLGDGPRGRALLVPYLSGLSRWSKGVRLGIVVIVVIVIVAILTVLVHCFRIFR